MRALLVRHGLTAETGTILSGRLPGVPLSATGRLAARVVADRLASRPIAAVYTSPVRRCRETARLVAAPLEITPITDSRLIEADYGSWSGRKLADLRRLKSWERLMANASRFRFPEGETLTEVQSRGVAAIEEMADRHGDVEVMVVSHSDVIRTVLCHYLGMPLDLVHRIHVAPTSVCMIELDPEGSIRVPVVNRTYEAPGTA